MCSGAAADAELQAAAGLSFCGDGIARTQLEHRTTEWEPDGIAAVCIYTHCPFKPHCARINRFASLRG